MKGRHLIRFLLAGLLWMASPFCSPIAATNLTGTFQKPDGTPVNGKLIFLLSQPARLSDNSAQVVPMVRIFAVTNGQLEANAFIYGNDVLVPTGTYYLVRLVDDSNNLLFEQKWSLQGTDLDLGTMTPTTTGVVLPDPLVKNVTTDQAVQGPVTFSGGITATSLTLNGSISPGADAVFDLGSSSAGWREIHARRWGGLLQPGTLGGLAIAPSGAPGIANSATGGSIAAGTYYIKIAYVTCTNAACSTFGETTASPSQSVATTGSTSRLQVAPNDSLWQSGAVGYYVYASTDNTTFYRQTLNPVGGNTDCQLDSQAHIVNCGSGSVLNSLTFSGMQPPQVNTAAIGPLQVALNSITTFGNPNTTSGIVLSNSTQTVTTPVVIPRNVRLDCNSLLNAQGSTAGRITSAITNTKLATVIIPGGNVQVDGCDIVNTAGNGLLLQNAVNGGNSVKVSNGSIRTTATSNTYDAVLIKGVWYDLSFPCNYMRGDKSVIHAKGTSGSGWVFGENCNGRWDAGGDYAVWHESAITDPDLNVNFGGFPNGVSTVVFRNLTWESADREWVHAVNMYFTLDNIVAADPSTLAGTASMIRIGADANGVGPADNAVRIVGGKWGNNANFGAAFFLASNTSNTMATLSCKDNRFGGITNWMDYNSVASALNVTADNCGVHLDANATQGKLINMNSATNLPTVLGDQDDGVAAHQYALHSFPGGVRFTDPNTNTNFRNWYWRAAGIATWFTSDPATTANRAIDWTSTNYTYLQSDGTTPLLDIDRTNNNVGIGRAAATGTSKLALANNTSISARNAANTAECSLVKLNTSDQVEIGGATSCFPRFAAASGNVPFTVNSGVSKVTNLDSDKWDGKDGIDFSTALDFGSMAAQSCAELTITATGAVADSPIAPSWPTALEANLIGSMRVSAADTVTVRLCNITGSAIDPASRTFGGRVIR